MKKIVCLFALIVISLFAATSVKAICQQTYKTSRTWQVGGIIYSHTETQIPFCSQIYYTNPAVESTFTEGATVLATGFNEGNASNYTEAKVDMGYYYPALGQTYCTYGNHYLISYYQVYVDYWGGGYYWYDPWQLGFMETGGGYDGPGIFGFGNGSYWESSVLYIGTTSACATYTGQTQCPVGQQLTPTGMNCNSNPTPTPTPTPPPPTISLESVGFKGDWKVKRIEGVEGSNTIDPNDTEPTWLKYSSDEPEPVAYTKGTTSTAFANFTLTNANPNYLNATIRVREGNTIYATIPNVNVSSNGQFSINTIPLSNLPFASKVGANKYYFTWEISFDGVNWTNFATSSQKIHWLYAHNGEPSFESDPLAFENNSAGEVVLLPIKPYEGIYDLGLEHSTGFIGTNGVDTPEEIAKTLTLHISDKITYNPNRASNDRNPLLVFGDFISKEQQCSANAVLLIALLQTVGIKNGEIKYYYGGGNNTRINKYHYRPNGTTDARVSMQVRRESVDSLPRDPHFIFHSTIILGSKSYDPSFGKEEANLDIYTAINDAGVCKYGNEANILKVTKTALEYRSVAMSAQWTTDCTSGVVDNSALVSQSVSSEMQLGQSYSVTITFINTGLTTWSSSEGYQLVSDNPLYNMTWGTNMVTLPSNVLPGQQVTFSFNVVAPNVPGNYNFQWKMQRSGIPFGSSSPNMFIEVASPVVECSWSDRQECFWRGGNLDPLTCDCIGGY